MRQFATAIFAALVAGCSFGATFVPKEYVDRMDATNRDFVIEYVNSEVANLVRKDNVGYITATNRAMTAIQQHQSLESVSNYTDMVFSIYSSTGMVRRLGTATYWQDHTGCVWKVSVSEEWMLNVTLGPGAGHTNYTAVTRYPFFDDGSYYEAGWVFEIGENPNSLNNVDPDATVLIGRDYYFYFEDGDEYYSDAYDVTYTFTRPLVTNAIGRVVLTSDLPDPSASVTHETVTNIVRDISRGGIWDSQLGVWWTPIMQNGALKYVATTNVDLTAEIDQ